MELRTKQCCFEVQKDIERNWEKKHFQCSFFKSLEVKQRASIQKHLSTNNKQVPARLNCIFTHSLMHSNSEQVDMVLDIWGFKCKVIAGYVEGRCFSCSDRQHCDRWVSWSGGCEVTWMGGGVLDNLVGYVSQSQACT